MPITLVSGSDFKDLQLFVVDQLDREIDFSGYDDVFLRLVDENQVEISQYDTAGNNKPLNIKDINNDGIYETLEVNIFGNETQGYSEVTNVYAQIDVKVHTLPYSDYTRFFDEEKVIELKPRL